MSNRNQWSNVNNGMNQSSIQYRLNQSVRFSAKLKTRTRLESSQHQLCAYVHRICLQNRLEGFNYCIRHILEDRSAPFRQCSYIHPQSGKRCPNAARRTDRRDSTLCPWHLKKLYLKRKQAAIQQIRLKCEESHKRNEEMKQVMTRLEHFCPNKAHDNRRLALDWVQLEDQSVTASDHLRKKMVESVSNLSASNDDDCSNTFVEDVLRSDPLDSDSESVDSNCEEPLKRAGVYAAEEVSLILREKMLRLQNLYIEQFKRFQYLLKEKKKNYLVSLKMEKEMNGVKSISQTMQQNLSFSKQDRDDYKRLKALWRYQRPHGQEALLKKEANEKRKAFVDGIQYKGSTHPNCIFVKEDEVCTNRTIPLSHYCQKHILYDVNQVLYRPCAYVEKISDDQCSPPCLNPIISYVHQNTCVYHKQLKTDIKDINKLMDSNEDDVNQIVSLPTEPELFQTMDDIASLGLDAVNPSNLFSLDQFGELESTDLLN
ncbi:KAT8 regulatory NSL complex subunit 2-like [Oppia nitens]|uniref:KAT8 regulatory NSL complex subunit 2-like n=1 Tax=Oppia nitens TaxID=1686743 RepID=UPI0023D9BB61|nr:KAT8 regulatory NSL complex subunit 2-like [Oppia nitens]